MQAYTAALSGAASGVCQSFVWGAEYVGKRQVVQRHLPDIQNRSIRATFTYIGKGLQWMEASGCATAMAIGINEACMSIEEGEYNLHLSRLYTRIGMGCGRAVLIRCGL